MRVISPWKPTRTMLAFILLQSECLPTAHKYTSAFGICLCVNHIFSWMHGLICLPKKDQNRYTEWRWIFSGYDSYRLGLQSSCCSRCHLSFLWNGLQQGLTPFWMATLFDTSPGQVCVGQGGSELDSEQSHLQWWFSGVHCKVLWAGVWQKGNPRASLTPLYFVW